MLKIETKYVRGVQQSSTLSDLHAYLQTAIELEHSTIPPYLTAMISFKPGKNREIWGIIHSVVIEEMLHLTIAANILNALNGHPVINKPDFIPHYPSPLPMGIREGLIVGLEKYSKNQVKNVFMEIEEPEDPINFPVGRSAVPEEYATIGVFYRAIQEKIDELAGNNLPGNPDKQVTGFFDEKLLFPILKKKDALKAIDIIVEQGEGTPTSPLDIEKQLAHYYLFAELFHGKKLVRSGQSYAYSGSVIPFEESGVHPISPNTKTAELPNGSAERIKAIDFNLSYNRLLNALHRTFNGEPKFIKTTIGLMFDIKLQGERLAATPFPGKPGFTIGPPFEYIDVDI